MTKEKITHDLTMAVVNRMLQFESNADVDTLISEACDTYKQAFGASLKFAQTELSEGN